MKRLLLVVALAATAISVVGFAGSSSASQRKTIAITMWSGQVDLAAKSLQKLGASYNASHPGVKVTIALGAPADKMVQKLEAALSGGKYPDIAYVFGSDAANVAQAEQVVDISDDVKATKTSWNDFYKAGRDTATVGGKVIGFPAVIDDLAVVYNKKLLKQAGVAPPKASWTWDDFRAMAKKLTNASSGTYGTGYPGAGGEDTVWRLWPMIWQQGGEILDTSGKKAAFQGAQGIKALTLLQQMAVKDRSMSIDLAESSDKLYGLFNSGKMAMVVTGPWQLGTITEAGIDYGVQVLPGYGGSHETIAGPDDWVVFDHGDDARRRAAVDFLAWLHEPAQDLQFDLDTGSLPLRLGTTKLPAFKRYYAKYPGVELFVKNLRNAKHIRPTIPQYTQLSQAIGKGIGAVLIGRGEPKSALAAAAKTVDGALK